MKYITIPQDERITVGQAAGTMSFEDLLRQVVWPNPVWRDGSLDNAKALRTLIERFNGCRPGSVVELDDRTYELFLPVVTMKGEKLNEQIAQQLYNLMFPVITASDERPEEPASPDPN